MKTIQSCTMFCAVEHLAISSSVLPQVFRFYVSDVVTKLKFSSEFWCKVSQCSADTYWRFFVTSIVAVSCRAVQRNG